MTTNKILFGFAPTMDTHDRFFNCYPGSILHAIAPLVDEVDSGRIDLDYAPFLFHPKNFDEKTLPNMERLIREYKPSFFAISSTYDSWHIALKMAKTAKRVNPDIIVIQGGPHLDEVLEPWVMRWMPHLNPYNGRPETNNAIDFAVAGDGEYSLLKIVNDCLKNTNLWCAREYIKDHSDEYRGLPGRGTVSFMDNNSEQVLLRYNGMLDLNAIPFVPRHLLPVSEMYDFDCFKDDSERRLETVTMITHRGCMARCNFCSEGLPYQQRSLEHVAAEADKLKALGVKALFLDDSTIQDDRNYLRMFSELHKRGFQIGALTRFDHLQDPNEVMEMRENGVTYVYASIEQYDDCSLGLMNKNLKAEQIDRGIENLRREGIMLGVSTLYGLPHETPESVSSTLDYVQRRVQDDSIEYVSMSLYSFHPRTPLGQIHRDLVRELDFDRGPPNLRWPFTGFEEGSWYHPKHVTADYVKDILVRANEKFGHRLVRNIGMHRGKNG